MASATDTRLTEEQRREQRDRRRFARRQWARRWMRWRIVVAALALVALVATAVWLVFFSAVLSVTKVTVDGNRLLGPDRVLAVAQVPMGEQLATVDLEAISRRVAVLAEVEDVDVTRSWPDGVRIDVTERTAVAVVELGGRLRGLDATGVVFRDYRNAPRGMPRVRPTTSTGADALAEAAGVVAVLPADLAARVDHVEVQTIDQITLVLRDGRQVLWGSAEQSELKARVLPELLAAQRAQVYDVSVPESPITRPS
ncbi:cell division protein FtsQ/DivIB [Nocardioides sediminis]|uniref:cell division protein FtsQ/DivIB n=1 Tax=Nocardioides sediminis TaxID=433648 RepID=UPI001F395076|nr:FtsQ-type POTRA domain-containing protein [Nocardioides sediminis]